MAEEEKEKDSEGEVKEEKNNKSSSKKFLIFLGLPIILFIIIAAVLYFMGALKGFLPNHGGGGKPPVEKKVEKEPEKILYYDLPEVFINMNSNSNQINFLKISLSLEVNNEKKVKKIEEMKPRIIDQLQIYLRQLRVDDLKGSAGLQKLREELTIRINSVLEPDKINDVLFKEVLLQ